MSHIIYEDVRNGAYLGRYDPDMSNEQVVFASGAFIEAGTVMGKITKTGKYVPLNPAASDGSAVPAGISYATVDATGEEQRAVITARLSTVKASELIWPDAILEQEKMAAIQSLEDNNKILLR
ncbi:head decoration protein [Bartonella machadoae]|uniref:head decoration protein n=1 Tax=Bartonella machadoae TaxID=2893471 RepID=UPI001F4D254E|nr:head decoration protein [Bartonella machadoae]UNE54647.1 head decoration protein [Bartonella machadoae]UNE55442.1 head decoration protein [Bartonella machadoae]UNE55521.1 head decoration protein [Bartonella machadoae]UNE55628.1 head decoration protein [Bartonella machadoae]UNE55633.1 head decoration protein [Bartonella machadoae]